MFVPTKSSFLRNKTEESCETVIFKGKRSASCGSFDAIDKMIEPPKKEDKKLDIKKLCYEVTKFGSTGFDGSKREESRVALAVALGAVPRKRKHKNYVKILTEKKAEEGKEHGKLKQTIAKYSSKIASSKQKSSRNKSKGLLNNYGRVKPSK